MKRATLKNLNQYIRDTYPELDVELWKPAPGWFVFSGPDQDVDDFYIHPIESILALSHASFDKWCAWIDFEIRTACEKQKYLKSL